MALTMTLHQMDATIVTRAVGNPEMSEYYGLPNPGFLIDCLYQNPFLDEGTVHSSGDGERHR